jgi:starch synthase
MAHQGGISYIKGGIQFSEMVTTVSPQYAREIQGSEMGYGLDGTLRARGGDLVGILNGVDYGEWDPRHDKHIAAPFSADDLAGKAECKRDLLATMGLPLEPSLPVVGVISRLVAQKGFDIVVDAWYDLLQRPIRMVVLGTGEPRLEQGLRSLAERAPDRFAVRLTYDEALAHKIEAGSDIFLMPSRFEPCGLTQMYSLRYGTVPVVRATGGLYDTVEPWDPATGGGTGFRFDNPDGTGLMWALDEALKTFADRPAWERLMRNGMERDFSWDRSADAYVGVYRRAMEKV